MRGSGRMTEARATIAAFLKEDPSWAVAKEPVFPTGKYPPELIAGR
jgi:hypothetical protein